MSFLKLRGVKVPHRKNTSGMPGVRIAPPKLITLPMSMHIGAPAVPVVKAGDEVLKGQLIARAGGFVSSPIYSPVSGKVKRIEEIRSFSGPCPAVIIENDGEDRLSPDIKPPVITDYKSFCQAVADSGVVGLGGAGFPAAVKITLKDLSELKEVIINGAECEPYITSDTRTMLDRTQDLREGFALLEKYLGVKKIIFGIEDNKAECIKAMSEISASDPCVQIYPLPSVYPQGGEKVLIYNTTGKVVPEGGLPINVGVVILNCTTLAAIAEYVRTGMPLIEKCVTVDGGAVKNPMNIIAPIGTPISDLIEFSGGLSCPAAKILYGGPMMGTAVPDDSYPIMKNTNAVLFLTEKESALPSPSACIRCGQCIAHCPMHLDPPAISKALDAKDSKRLLDLHVGLCMECGCCSFICPAHRPIVQNQKLAKAAARKYSAEQKEAKDK